MLSEDLNTSDRTFWAITAALVLCAMVLRLYRLGELPGGLYCDEAATGYDAFCLLKTGKPLHENSRLLFFAHYGVDFVESLYTYLSVPFISLFGLSVSSTRMLAAIAGSLTVLTTCLLARELHGKSTALLAACIVTFSPWHLVFSRVAFRGILLPLFVTLGVLLFLRGLRQSRNLTICALAFGLALHTYSVSKLLVPLILCYLIYTNRALLRQSIRSGRAAQVHSSLGLLLLAVLTLPVFAFSFLGPGNDRFSGISIVGDPNPAIAFVQNYLLHLTPGFLFLEGDPNLRHGVPGYGQLLLVLLPFVVVGIFAAVKAERGLHRLPVALFLIGLVPPAMTREGLPHALRAIGAFPFLELTAAAGMAIVLKFALRSEGVLKAALLVLMLSGLSFGSVGFVHAYFNDYQETSQGAFQDGMEKLVRVCEGELDNYDFVAIPATIRQAYIFVLFFGEPDPTDFQGTGNLGKYLVDVREISRPGKYLIVADSVRGLMGHKPKYWISEPGNEPVLAVFEYTVPRK